MKNLAIAKRYAKALLMIGKEDGQAEAYQQELSGFADLISQEAALQQAINNPQYDASARRNVLKSVLEKLTLSKPMQAFLMLLFDKGRFSFLDSISELYAKLADELKGVARASVVSATALSDDAIEKIRSGLKQRTGKEVILEVNQDPSLIGGIVTRIGDLVLDGSIRTQLRNMKETLKRGEGV